LKHSYDSSEVLTGEIKMVRFVELLLLPSLLGHGNDALPQSRFQELNVFADPAKAPSIFVGPNSRHNAMNDGVAI
jgi:hypothetical protein